MLNLKGKIDRSRKVIQDAQTKFAVDKTVVAWTGGKDSTVLLHLIKSPFDFVPFPVMFTDSTMEFKEVYEFIKKVAQQWKLNLVIVPHLKEDLTVFYRTRNKEKRKELIRIMKINVINDFVKKHHIKAFISGIRWDEHESRSKENYFSARKDHIRIHPILHFTEENIWQYIKEFNVPYVNLYDKGYRSLGEKPFTKKAIPGGGERSGRDYDKEQAMERLRNMGYW